MDMKYFLPQEGEKPLDNLVTDGGFFKIFRTVACIGDSLASGELESYEPDVAVGFHDFFEYSWGQYMAREAGVKVYNFSRGGMTAKEYNDTFAERMGYWDEDKLCQAYIVALGVNDLFGHKQELGKISDISKESMYGHADTFAAHYAQIIQHIKTMQPDAKFFLMTMPKEGDNEENDAKRAEHAKLLHEMAEYFSNTYVIDLYEYAPTYDAEFKKKFFLGGHMNPAGYILTAKMTMSYIDYIVRHNFEDFKQVGFIGKPYHNHKEKW